MAVSCIVAEAVSYTHLCKLACISTFSSKSAYGGTTKLLVFMNMETRRCHGWTVTKICIENMYRKTRFRKEKMLPEPCFLAAMHMEEAAGDSFCKYSCCHCRKWAGFCTYAVNKKTSAFCTPCCLVSVCVSKNISIWCPRTPPPLSSAVYTTPLIITWVP